jgi:hypothetical protein
MDNSLDELVDLTQEQKTEHIFKVMCEWPSTRVQLRLENIYDPKSGINLGDKFWTNQQFSALKVYNKLDASTEDISSMIWQTSRHHSAYRTIYLYFKIKFYQSYHS